MVVLAPLTEVATAPVPSTAVVTRARVAHVTPVLERPIAASGDIELPVEPPPVSTDPALFRAVIIAYSSSPDETDGDPFITASGRRVFDGLVACPRRYPFGTQVKIAGRTYTCWDRLHDRFDDRFDIWMASKSQALQFGLRKLVVQVVG